MFQFILLSPPVLLSTLALYSFPSSWTLSVSQTFFCIRRILCYLGTKSHHPHAYVNTLVAGAARENNKDLIPEASLRVPVKLLHPCWPSAPDSISPQWQAWDALVSLFLCFLPSVYIVGLLSQTYDLAQSHVERHIEDKILWSRLEYKKPL